MKILIICSKKFYNRILNIKNELEENKIEVQGFAPLIINGDLSKIKEDY